MSALFTILSLAAAPVLAAWPWAAAPSSELIYEVEASGKPSIDAALADRAADVLRKRLSSFGLEGAVERRGAGRVAVVLRVAGDAEGVLAPLLRPARLELRLAGAGPKAGAGEVLVPEAVMDPETLEVKTVKRAVQRKVLMTGADIAAAHAGLDDGRPFVALEFSPAGAAKLATVTQENVGRRMAVLVDGRVLTVAVINSPISGGRLSLSGAMTADEARDTARVLASGALPVKLTLTSKVLDGRSVAVAAEPAPGRPAVPVAAVPAASPPPVSDVDFIPPSLGRGRFNGAAVVIGVERTRQGLPRADYAAKDATVFARYLVETLGYPEENVVLLLDERAAKSDLEKYLEDWLPRKVGPGGTAVVFFSGHGAPDAARGKAYLVPYDGDPGFLEKTAYPMARLTETLAGLKGRRAIILADACFSGAGKRSALAKGARPLATKLVEPVKPGPVAVLSAAAADQIGGSYDEKGHGLFTYFVLSALREEAARGRVPSMTELHRAVTGKVEAAARRLSGNEQTPQLQASPDAASGSL